MSQHFTVDSEKTAHTLLRRHLGIPVDPPKALRPKANASAPSPSTPLPSPSLPPQESMRIESPPPPVGTSPSKNVD
ncbi:hypothetical protein ColTof3_14657 [Colletotrichum tofieldiae]|nr:hypothetical protein ColTof3_14657 [Colletotrichum tofieldiae]